MRRENRLLICLLFFCLVVVRGYAQKPLTFDEFFHGKMEKRAGILPVYQDSVKVYLEIPESLLGREIEIRAQINKGFDMVARPLESLGVVYIEKVEKDVVYLQRRIFSERVKSGELCDALKKSNRQPLDIMYPIKAYAADKKGYIIDITDLLKVRDDWFKVVYASIEGQNASLAKVAGVHSFPDGVSFSIQRMYGFTPKSITAGTLTPSGFLPIEIGCIITVLPEQGMEERFADERIGYNVVRFLNYSQNPYCAVKDSIIRKWNLGVGKKDRKRYERGELVIPLNPIVFYVDTCFPKEFVPYIKEGILAWNTAFERAGFKHVLQVKMADSKTCLVEQRAVIAYDLGEVGIKAEHTFHPKTGEILSCRINLGHGFLVKELSRYLLQCGMADARIRKDRFHSEVAGEILRSKVTRAVGSVLGLKDAAQAGVRLFVRELVPRVSDYDCWAIGWGYREYSQEREVLPEYLFATSGDSRALKGDLSVNPLKVLKYGLENMRSLYELLDSIVYPDKKYDSGKSITEVHAEGMKLYGEYLMQVVACMASGVTVEEQHEAMEMLNEYLFKGENYFCSRLMKENMLGRHWEVFIQQAKKVFQKLLAPEVIRGVTDTESLFEDLFSMLFGGDMERVVSHGQMDMQVLCVDVLLELMEKMEVGKDLYAFVVKQALQELGARLNELKDNHTDKSVRVMSKLLLARVGKNFVP
ncbi:DUF5117 domain-containing protein [Butyricimonas sp.]|uniref:DUF5117 and DUF5118 domain-containing protein n=1 Tax=Butyricimonas sp. TaxID=1969738 RepID=UPI0025BC8876|nr:DUF5117 domain-containing protein [Butyricimonas sp.]